MISHGGSTLLNYAASHPSLLNIFSLINSIEQLIATVQEPEDVEEEELWPEDDQFYEADDEHLDQPVVQYLDAPTPRRRYREPQVLFLQQLTVFTCSC